MKETKKIQSNDAKDAEETKVSVGRAGKIGSDEVRNAAETLKKYKDGKASIENRIVENEKWYKLRHWEVIGSKSRGKEPEPASAWLFNSLANKHADMMDNYPEPVVLPREESDKQDAEQLSAIMPVILERNNFIDTYSKAANYKIKNGTSAYGVFWNNRMENGLGDIDIKRLDLLNLFWEPGVEELQNSRNLFVVELVHNDILAYQYPQLKDRLGGNSIDVKEYIYDDTIDNSDKSVVVDWYYKAWDGTKEVLHFCKFTNEEVLYASENDPVYAERGFYDHGRYPIVFDTLFSIEGSPVGFGYIDVCKEPQLYIDKLDQIIVTNAFQAGKTRFFVKDTSAVNLEEFADWSKDFVSVAGNLSEENLREFKVTSLPGFIIQHKQNKIEELKETSGNTSYAQGTTTSGVTAASAIAALQEASGKLSRDMIRSSYSAFNQVCILALELIRQFYDEPRCFRIDGGADQQEQFVQYDNTNIRMMENVDPITGEEDARRPIFDIKVSAQKQSPFSRAAQNELAKELYGMGLFNPQFVDQAVLCLEMMQFEGKEDILNKIRKNGTMYEKLQQLAQAAMAMATQLDQLVGSNAAAMISQILSGKEAAPMPTGTGTVVNQNGAESNITKNAKERTAGTTTP